MKSAFAVYKSKVNGSSKSKNKSKGLLAEKVKAEDGGNKTSLVVKSKKKRTRITPITLNNEENLIVNELGVKNGSRKRKSVTPEINRHDKKVIKTVAESDNDSDEIPQLIEIPSCAHATPFDFMEVDFPTKSVSVMKWLIYPLKLPDFFELYWEKGPLHITRNNTKYYSRILTTSDVDMMLRENPLYFGRNVDIVAYRNGERITENPEGRAKASIVLNAYAEGYSVRILNPQTYNTKVHYLLATLQEYFGTMVGANVYLTPAGSQGFAPHFDDIEAFVVQLEGRKHWKLYKPRNDSDHLARLSSGNFKREELGELIKEVTLNAGDILYFPRGVVHEAKTDDEMHSLHLTVSTYQKTAYVDLLEKILPEALRKAASEDITYRKGLPVGYLNYVGVVNAHKDTQERKQIINTVHHLVKNLCKHICIDNAADQLGRKFIYEALPPALMIEELQTTSRYDGDKLLKGKLVDRVELEPDTEIRIIRYHALRLVIEKDESNIYFSTENSKVYHGEEEQFITINMDMCPVIEALMEQYPKFISIEKLPHVDIAKKIEVITELWDYGIIVTKDPLELCDDASQSESETENIL